MSPFKTKAQAFFSIVKEKFSAPCEPHKRASAKFLFLVVGLLLPLAAMTSLGAPRGSQQKKVNSKPKSAPSVLDSANPTPSPSPSPSPSAGAEAGAPIQPPELVFPNPKLRLKDLKWDEGSLQVVTEPLGEEIKVFVKIKAKHLKKNPILFFSNQRLPIGEDGTFELKLPISQKASRFEIMQVDTRGGLKKELFGILFDEWERHKQKSSQAPPKRWFISVGASASVLLISDPRVPSFVQIGPTLKASYTHLIFPPSFDFGASAYFTLFGVAPGSAYTARFLGINARAGYVLPWPADPWRISILVGGYYVAMFGTPPRIGFTNVAGPQIFPTIRYRFPKGRALIAYFKFSPITNGIGFLSLANREIASGATFILPRPNGHSFTFSFDFSNLALSGIQASSFNFGFGYGF